MQTTIRNEAAEYARIMEISTVVVLLIFTTLFTFSKKINSALMLGEEMKKAEIITIESVPVTIQRPNRSKPVTIKIPLPMDDEEESDDEIENYEIAEMEFKIGEEMPPPPSFTENSDDPLPFFAIQEKPKLLNNIYSSLQYPAMAKRTGISGSVTMKFTCSKKGIPINIRIIQERPADMGFGVEAVKALKKARFTPGFQNDRPVKVNMIQKINFKVK